MESLCKITKDYQPNRFQDFRSIAIIQKVMPVLNIKFKTGITGYHITATIKIHFY